MPELRAALIGRDNELARVHAVLDALSRGTGWCVAVTGEGGIGKTRLIEELAAEAEARGFRVLSGRGSAFSRHDPFAIMVDALDTALSELTREQLDAFGAERLAELGRVFPALSDWRVPVESDLQSERWRLYRAIAALKEVLAIDAPVVLILDDAHWADEASVEVIVDQLARPFNAAFMLVLSYRERAVSPALAAAVARGERERAVRRIPLRPLDAADAQRLVGGDGVPLEVVDQLVHESGGNPFYLLELFRAWRAGAVADDGLGGRDGDTAEVPPAVQAAIIGELAGLSEGSRVLLRCGSLLGDPFELGLAAAMAGHDQARALSAVDELVASGLLRTTGRAAVFAFRHPIVHRAVYDSMDGEWRSRGHARAAEAMTSRGDPVTALARHLEHSAQVGDEDAVAALTAAGNRVAARAPAAAARWYESAMRLLPTDAPPERKLGLLLPTGKSLLAAGNVERCRRVLQAALAATPESVPGARARVLGVIASVDIMRGRADEAERELSEALSSTAGGTSVERTTLELEAALTRWFLGDLDGVVVHAETAAAGAAELSEPLLGAEAMAAAAMGEYYRGNPARARQHALEAERILSAHADHELALHVRALLFIGIVGFGVEQFDAAVRRLGRGIQIARTTGQDLWFVALTSASAHAHGWLGRLDEAAQRGDTAREAALTLGDDHAMIWTNATRSWIAAQQGDARGALQYGRQAASAASRLPTGVYGRLAYNTHAEALIMNGEPERGIDAMLAGGNEPDLRVTEPATRSYWFEVLSRAEIARGRHEAAERWVRLAEDTTFGMIGREGMAMRARALLQLSRGEPAAAADSGTAAAERLFEVGQRVDAARALVVVGRALTGVHRSRAVEVLELAHETLRDAGSPGHARQAAEGLRVLGRRTAPTRTHPGEHSRLGALSARELEVASLVGEGMSNQSIAERLYVTVKTVETHMSRIYAKLGLSSRAALAGLLERETGANALRPPTPARRSPPG